MAETHRYRVAVVDDDPAARRSIRTALAEEPRVEVVAEIGSGEEAVEVIPRAAPEVVLLDVEMPGLSGLDVVSEIGVERMPPVVFVTAYERHAVRAFELHAVDYVLKPFAADRLRAAVRRALRRLALDRTEETARSLRTLLGALDDPLAEPGPPAARGRFLERFVVRDRERIRLVPAEEIDWLEADGNYVRLHAGDDEHVIRATLGGTLDRLDPARFVRIHRSWAVNVDRIAEVQPWFGGDYIAILEDGEQLRISRTYKSGLLDPPR